MRSLSELKLCFLAGTLEHGGAERQLYYILQALCRAGAGVRLLSLDRGEFWERRIKELGVPITWVGEQPSRLGRLFRVLKELHKSPAHVLQSQHFYANTYVGAAALLIGASGIGALRSNGVIEVCESGTVGGWLNLHAPPILAANSRIAMRYAIARGIPSNRLFFLPNVVDTAQFQPPADGSTDSLTLIAVGRLVKEKRLDRFIWIISRLRNEYGLNARGLIVGQGCQDEDLEMELTHQARHCGLLPDMVKFCGAVAQPQVLYQKASVCVLTSDYEGTPNVLLEAMASGLPVVASRVGGVPDIVRPGETGLLFEPGDLEGFASALAGLLKDRDRRSKMGRQARAFVEENHSLRRLPSALEQLYRLTLPSVRETACGVVQGAPRPERCSIRRVRAPHIT